MNLKLIPTPEFVKQVKKLAKNYKKIAYDLEELKSSLLKHPTSGIKLKHNCYKIRLANSSIPTGKSGGFRVIIYFIDTNDTIRLLLIYSKTEIDNISNKELEDILNKNGI